MLKFYKKALALLMAAATFLSAIPIYATGVEDTTAIVETAEDTEPTEILEPEEVAEPEYTYKIAGLGDVFSASVKTLGTSAKYYNYKCEAGSVKQNAHVIMADISRGAILAGKSLGDAFGTRGKVSMLQSDAEDENRLVAAINADFFSTATGVPMGVFVEDGRFVSSSDNRAAIGINQDGKVFIGHVGDSITLTHSDDEYIVSYINKYPTVYGTYLLTRDFGATTRLSEKVAATEYIIELTKEISLGTKVRGKVKEVRKGVVNGEIPEDCAVLVVPDLYENSAAYTALDKGDRVYIEAVSSKEFEDAESAIGGGDIILLDGEVMPLDETDSVVTSRHPRTALGITESGNIVLLVLDGRKNGVASGAKLAALAEAMRDLGCTDAINLDGGGSSVMVHYSAETSTIVNSPSDGTERKVPNALVLYENRDTANALHTIKLSANYDTLLCESRLPLKLTVYNALSEEVEFDITEENVSFEVDELFGSIEISDGIPYFIAANTNGYGIIRARADIDGEIIEAELFLTVTDTIDTLKADQNIILSDTDKTGILDIRATFGEKEVFFGDLLSVQTDNSDILLNVNKNNVKVSLFEETTEEKAEEVENIPQELPESAAGILTISLTDKYLQIPVFFDNDPLINLGEMLSQSLDVENEGYTLTFEDGVFYVESPVIETTAEETTVDITVEETTVEEPMSEETTETLTAEETTAEETIAETSETAVPEETSFFEEASAPSETYVAETTFPEETTVIEAEPFDVKINADEGAPISKGLSGRRIWMWVDGIPPCATPYTVIKVGSEDSVIYFDKYYDFSAYNGKALLTTVLPESEEIISFKTLIGYTALDEVQKLALHSPILSKELDTNLYTDTAAHWSSFYVNSLSYMGIVNGSENLAGELVFNPDNGLSREQFAKVLVNYLKINPDDYTDTAIVFEDADEIAQWAIPYVRAAVGAGLMRGRSTPEDTVIFAPRDGITRQEALYVLGGLLGDISGTPLEFTDSDKIAPWAADNLEKALSAALISGYDDGSIRPEGGITRAEAATVVVKLYTFLSKNSCIPPV